MCSSDKIPIQSIRNAETAVASDSTVMHTTIQQSDIRNECVFLNYDHGAQQALLCEYVDLGSHPTYVIAGSLQVKLPTICRDGKADVGRVREEKSRSEKSREKKEFGPLLEIQMLKSEHPCGAKHISKSKCSKHTNVRPLLEVELSKKCTPFRREAHCQDKIHKTHMFGPLLEVQMSKQCTRLWPEAHFQVKMYKTHQVRTTFGSSDVETVHAVVARCTFPSQHVQSTPTSNHFWKFRCRKSARGCGAKHMSKSTCTKHSNIEPLLEVQMSKQCTRLWPEAHFQVNMYKTHQVRTTFGSSDVETVHAVVARSTFPSQHAQNKHRFGPRSCGTKHICK